MPKTGPSETEVEALANAMCMVLNDLAEGGGVCDFVKASARIAMEPFLLEDSGELPDLEWAREIVAAHD